MAVIKMPKDMPPTIIDESSAYAEWPKMAYLVKKGYSREEAEELVKKLAAGEIRDITNIPAKKG
jgi:predicted RNase H-like HicB family nuclease